MAAKKTANKDVEVMVANGNTSNHTQDKSDEVIENLKTQYQEYAKAAEEAKTMSLKALGALEVLMSMKQGDNNGK